MIKSLETAYQELMQTDIMTAYSVCLSSGCLPEMVAVFKSILDHTERKVKTIKEKKLKVAEQEVTAMEEFIVQGRALLNKPDTAANDIRDFVMKTLFDGLLVSITSENEEPPKAAQAARVKSRLSETSDVKARGARVSASELPPKRKVGKARSSAIS